MISSAAMELWGITTALKFTFNVSWFFHLKQSWFPFLSGMLGFDRAEKQYVCLIISEVEKDIGCLKFTMPQYPSQCLFRDILKLVENPPSNGSWKPGKLKLVEGAFCEQHQQWFFG